MSAKDALIPSSPRKGGKVKAVPDRKGPARSRGGWDACALLFLLLCQAKTREPLLEPRQATATIDQLLCAAGPRRMRLRVDVEAHGVAEFTPRRTRQKLGAVGHDDLDRVIARMNVGFHDLTFPAPA